MVGPVSSPEEAPVTANELVANNVLRLRADKGWKQKDLAERLSAQTGRPWDFSMVSKAETGKRKFSPDELVAFVRVFQIPLFELFLAEDEERVDMGGVPIRGDDFFQLVFWMPSESEWRHRLADNLYGEMPQDGLPSGVTQLGRHTAAVISAMTRLIEEGIFNEEVARSFIAGDRGAWNTVTSLLIGELGVERFMDTFGSLRFREAMKTKGWARLSESIVAALEGDEEE